MKLLGEKLWKLREERGLSQEELAEKLDVSRQTVSNWENDRATPDAYKLKQLCETLGIGADELLEVERAPHAQLQGENSVAENPPHAQLQGENSAKENLPHVQLQGENPAKENLPHAEEKSEKSEASERGETGVSDGFSKGGGSRKSGISKWLITLLVALGLLLAAAVGLSLCAAGIIPKSQNGSSVIIFTGETVFYVMLALGAGCLVAALVFLWKKK